MIHVKCARWMPRSNSVIVEVPEVRCSFMLDILCVGNCDAVMSFPRSQDINDFGGVPTVGATRPLSPGNVKWCRNAKRLLTPQEKFALQGVCSSDLNPEAWADVEPRHLHAASGEMINLISFSAHWIAIFATVKL